VSTVYRSLELLEQIGLITHTHLGHGANRYHLAANAQHSHLVCRECGAVTEVDPAAVAALVSELHATYGFETDVGHLTVFGTCAQCRSGQGS
jgi:Fur family ferric uptake transcriptional regulator